MNYIDITKRDIKIQQELLERYQSQLESLPEGKLHCKMMRGTLRYFRWDQTHKVQQYIKKKDAHLIEELKHRRVLEEAILTMERNLKIQELIIKRYKAYDPHSCQRRLGKVYQDLPEKLYGMKEKKNAFFVWRGSESNFRRDDLIHKSSMGILFRSKSEGLIGEIYHKYGIPFYYESKLILFDENGDRVVFFPDFKIPLPDGRIIYHEHFGRMDLPEYREKNYKKLSVYHHNNILPPNNLIITMDDKKGGLDISGITQIIETQVLPFFK